MDQQYLMMRWHSGEARESAVQSYFYWQLSPLHNITHFKGQLFTDQVKRGAI